MFWGGESSVILDVDVFRVPSAWNLEINGRNYVKLQRQRFFSEQRLHMDRNDDVVVCTGAERIGHTPEHDGAIAEEHVVSNLHLFDNLKIRKKFTSVRLSSASVAYFLVVGWDCAVHFLRSAPGTIQVVPIRTKLLKETILAIIGKSLKQRSQPYRPERFWMFRTKIGTPFSKLLSQL